MHYPFDDDVSRFTSSDPVLNDVWDLCKHSIKATSFCGVYIDGDRERIPYEADAYIDQLCHYCVDREYAMVRYTHEYLLMHPTWPTEWILHSVLMAWADYLYTGNNPLYMLLFPKEWNTNLRLSQRPVAIDSHSSDLTALRFNISV